MRPTESFVEQPVRSLQTMLRVLSKDNSKYIPVVPDGIYGQQTMQAVTVFQRLEGLPVTGVVDMATWEQIVLRFEDALVRTDKAEPIEILIEPGQVFRRGDSSPYVYLLQSMLIQISQDYNTIVPPDHTGTLDAVTENAIIAFQKLTGLTETGEFDRITWKNLVHQYTLYLHHTASRYNRKN